MSCKKRYLTVVFAIIYNLSFIAYDSSAQNTLKKETTLKDTVSSILKDTIAQPHTPYNLVMFGHETALFIKQPINWKWKQWATLGGGIGITAFTMVTLDKKVRLTTGNDPDAPAQQNFYNSVWVQGGRLYGEWFMIPGMAAAFGTYGIIAKKDKSKKIAIELVQAGLFAEGLTFVLKYAIGRARPYTNEGPYSFSWFEFSSDSLHSIPSGHTSGAWALSAVIAGTASKDWVKFVAYIPAGFTMFSRIYQDKHWFSDSVAGALIGYFVGNWVVDLHSEKKHEIKVTSNGRRKPELKMTSIYPPGVALTFN